MNDATLRNATTDELLRFVDRSNPEVKALAERLERYVDFIEEVRREMDGLVGARS